MTININHGHSKYKPEYCDMLIEHMSQGYSFDTFPAIVRVGRSTMYVWLKDIPEFKEAHEIGNALALKYFETAIKSASSNEKIDDKVLRTTFNPKNINIATMQWFIKCRYSSAYSEKIINVIEGGDKPVEIKTTSNLTNLSLDELKALREIQRKLNA